MCCKEAMEDNSLEALHTRLASLESRVRWYKRLLLLLGLGLILGVSLAARSVPAGMDLLRVRRFEVVDEAGKVGVVAYATPKGGRLEVLQATGRPVFATGTVQGAPDPVGSWEQTLQTLEWQGRTLEQQHRMLDDLSRQLQRLPQTRQTTPEQAPHSNDIAQLRSELEQQRRTVEHLDRQLQSLSQQLRSLERR
jgi:hypothetical protein